MPFLTNPVVACKPDGVSFQLVEHARYRGKVDDWTIPAGFGTDFATIPAVVSWAIPKLGAYTQAAIAHDYFCAAGILFGEISARDTDAVFRRIMRELGVDAVTRWLVWTGVRWGALFNPIRRPEWWKDAPAVLFLSLLAAPVIVPASLLAVGGRLVLRAASAISRLFRR
ncbi:DUF1353 domain-containing protein [Lentzea sp. JNUCC 0626]|uniref:DUF1353 domain-containing protein n=1 Tax=Lentzea sp. JNUCC 0626 TaxID=3367513 RepID=UPI003748C9F6